MLRSWTRHFRRMDEVGHYDQENGWIRGKLKNIDNVGNMNDKWLLLWYCECIVDVWELNYDMGKCCINKGDSARFSLALVMYVRCRS